MNAETSILVGIRHKYNTDTTQKICVEQLAHACCLNTPTYVGKWNPKLVVGEGAPDCWVNPSILSVADRNCAGAVLLSWCPSVAGLLRCAFWLACTLSLNLHCTNINAVLEKSEIQDDITVRGKYK